MPIAGIASARPAAECQPLVAAMLESMRHEPFYESGTCHAPECRVYAGWTAPAGSFASRQRTSRPDVSVVMSGECLSDGADVSIAEEYDLRGDRFAARLNGLFSGVVIDRARRTALLFNDRYGLERLYVHETSDAFYFASEAKALLRVCPELASFDEQGVAEFLAFGCTHGRRTLFRGIELLPGASMVSFSSGGVARSQYFRPETWEAQREMGGAEFEAAFQQTFARVLPRYLGSGAGLGISLTGGLDTRMIMACLPRLPHAPICYTFSGEGTSTLDERLAARVAGACGLEHRALRLGRRFLADYPELLDRTVHVTDGCFGAMGAHEIYLNAQARELAPVRLTGNFGSELLRSVSTFKPLKLAPALLDPWVHAMVASAEQNVLSQRHHPVTFAAFQEIPRNLFGGVSAARSQLAFRTPYLDNEIVALAFCAPARLRRSSEPALRLVNGMQPALGRIPTDRGLMGSESGVPQAARRLLADVTFKLDYLHKDSMPQWLLPIEPLFGRLSGSRLLGPHKFLQYRLWFKQELASHVHDVLTDPGASRLPFWRRGVLRSIACDHINGRRNYVREINAVLTLDAIHRLLLRGRSTVHRTRPPLVATYVHQ
jgi:asparagine synthase (glutamine-hydrolysing)